MLKPCVRVPSSGTYIIQAVNVPVSTLEGVDLLNFDRTVDDLCLADLHICDGLLSYISPHSGRSSPAKDQKGVLINHRNGMALPTFVDLHTHIGQPDAHFTWLGSCGTAFLASVGAIALCDRTILQA